MKFAILLIVFAAYRDLVLSQVLDCRPYDSGAGCVSNSLFSVQYTGKTYGTSSGCNRQYKITVKRLPSGRRGIYCTFTMLKPNGYVYTMSGDSRRPMVAGYKNIARLRTYRSRSYISVLATWPTAHAKLSNGWSKTRWGFHDRIANLYMYYSREYAKFRDSHLATPTSGYTYIGVNRDYYNRYLRGSGVCRIKCYTTTAYSSGETEATTPSEIPITGIVTYTTTPSTNNTTPDRGFDF